MSDSFASPFPLSASRSGAKPSEPAPLDGFPLFQTVTVRLRRREDTLGLFALFNERVFLDNASTHGPFEAPRAFEAWLDGVAPAGRYELVADSGAEIVAFGGLYAFPDLMSHCGSLILGVKAAWQRNGLGSTILRRLLDAAETMVGLSKIQITVLAHNQAALELYRGVGFEVEGRHRHFCRRGDGFADAYSMALFFDATPPLGRTAGPTP